MRQIYYRLIKKSITFVRDLFVQNRDQVDERDALQEEILGELSIVWLRTIVLNTKRTVRRL